MSDNLMEKVSAFGERLKITGAEVSRKMSAGMNSMSFKLRELLEDQTTSTITTAQATAAERMVEEATTSLESKSLQEEEVKWSLNLHICDLINDKRIDSGEIIRSIKKRMVMSSSRTQPRVEYLCMILLEMLVNNCDKAVSDQMTSEGVVDELVKLTHHPNTESRNRDKALLLIKEWRESCCELQYLLYTHEQTYKRLQSRRVTDDSGDMKGSSSEPISADQSGSAKNVEQLLNDQYDHNKHDQIHVDDQTNTYKLVLLKEKQRRVQMLDVARNSIELLRTVISSSSSPYIHDPSEEELATTVVEQCRRSQYEVQRMITSEIKGHDALMFEEALNINDHLHDILTKHEDQLRRRISRNHYEPPPADDPQSSLAATSSPDRHNQHQSSSSYNKTSLDQQVVDDDLDEMIFGNIIKNK